MPYIPPSAREWLKADTHGDNAGELNFQITSIVKAYLDEYGESYQVYNDLIGVLECAKMELYRRMVAPYEDKKIQENGDVY